MSKISESEFYMWRTLFAVAHADDVVTSEELRFMAEVMEDVPFTEEQQAILNADITAPQDVEAMFARVTDQKDQAAFFKYARNLVHIDGDYGADEQSILLKLQKTHLKGANVDDLVGSMRMELEEDVASQKKPPEIKRTWLDKIFDFFERFQG